MLLRHPEARNVGISALNKAGHNLIMHMSPQWMHLQMRSSHLQHRDRKNQTNEGPGEDQLLHWHIPLFTILNTVELDSKMSADAPVHTIRLLN